MVDHVLSRVQERVALVLGSLLVSVSLVSDLLGGALVRGRGQVSGSVVKSVGDALFALFKSGLLVVRGDLLSELVREILSSDYLE